VKTKAQEVPVRTNELGAALSDLLKSVEALLGQIVTDAKDNRIGVFTASKAHEVSKRLVAFNKVAQKVAIQR
jgi:hypothetical protein